MLTVDVKINKKIIRRVEIKQIKKTNERDGRLYYYEVYDIENAADYKNKLDMTIANGVIGHNRNDGPLMLIRKVLSNLED